SDVAKSLGDLNELLRIKGVLEGIKDDLDKLKEQLNGIVKINAKVKVGPEGPEVYTTDLGLVGEKIASLTAEIERIQQAIDAAIEKLKPAIKITKGGTVEVEGGSNFAATIAKISNEGKVEVYRELPNNIFQKLEVPPENKIGLATSKTVEISNGELHGTTLSPDILNLERANLINEKVVNEFSQIPEEISRLEAQFKDNETTIIPISKEFADYLQAKFDALRSQIEQITSTTYEIYQNAPDFRTAQEEIARLGLTDQLKSATNELKTLNEKLISLRQIGDLLNAIKEKTTIDIEPLLKDYIDGKISNVDELADILNEKLYNYYKPRIDSLENDILNELQKKGATPDQIAQVKSEIDRLTSKQLDEIINPKESTNITQVLDNVSKLVEQLNEIEALAKNASNANDIVRIINERLGGGSSTKYEIRLKTKTENQPLGTSNQNVGQSNTPSATTSGGAKITTSGNQQLIQLQKADVGTITLRYSLSDVINTARQILGKDFDSELYVFSQLFGKDSIEQAILDAAKKSPTPDLDSIARTFGDVIKSKVDEGLKTSPDKVVTTIEDMLKINNDLVRSKLTTDLLNFIKNNPKATFRDLLTFTEKDLPKIVNDVKDTLITTVLDQLSKGFGDLTNLIGKDSLKTFLENEIKNGVFDVNKLLDDAKAFVDSRLAELLKANPEKILSTILDSAKIGNKLVRDKLLADALEFVKRFGGNVTLQDIAEFIAKDAADLKIQLARALNSGNLEELAKIFPALKNVIEELKKDPLKGLRQYFSLIDPTLANALNKITPDNALDILNALKNNDLAKISQITGLSVDQLKSPQVKLSIISEIFDDLMEKLKAKQITDKEFESAVESLKVMLDEALKDYKNLLGDYGDNLREQLQEVENNVKRKRIPKVVELYKTVIPSVAALPVVLSIESASDVSYLLNYAEQLPSEEQAPLVSEQMPQQQVQVQEGATVLPTPVEPETPTLAEPLAPPPTAPNGEEQPTYQPQMGPNAPALISGRNTRSVSGETQEQVLYFPIS
ncbi:MAG: hypothetical protein QXD27_08655, partial [Metallosphaera sp.]